MDKGAEARRRRREEREMEGRMCEWCGGKIGGGAADYCAGPRCDCGHPKPASEPDPMARVIGDLGRQYRSFGGL